MSAAKTIYKILQKSFKIYTMLWYWSLKTDKYSHIVTHFSQPNPSSKTIFITILKLTLGLLPRQRGSQVTVTQPNLIINHDVKGFQSGAGAKALI